MLANGIFNKDINADLTRLTKIWLKVLEEQTINFNWYLCRVFLVSSFEIFVVVLSFKFHRVWEWVFSTFFSDQVFETLNEPENTIDDESEDEDQTKKIFYSAKKKLEQVKTKICCNKNANLINVLFQPVLF